MNYLWKEFCCLAVGRIETHFIRSRMRDKKRSEIPSSLLLGPQSSSNLLLVKNNVNTLNVSSESVIWWKVIPKLREAMALLLQATAGRGTDSSALAVGSLTD